jgi:NAD(P)-dependent dehydrogenase (short-subunit alcohol dehydrogenase family)
MASSRLAVVSGGASGIGLAIAERLLAEGYRVAVADLRPPVLEGTAGLIETAVCDIAGEESVNRWFTGLQAEHGAVYLFVHSAGIYPPTPFAELDLPTWRRIMAVNLEGFFLGARAVLDGMLAARAGRIVGVASNTFFDGTAGLVPYVASKGGMIGMVRSLASELGAAGITVNAIAPSITDTPTTRAVFDEQGFAQLVAHQAIPRLALPRDYAGVAAFLASDDAAFITGQTLIVDGGWTHG